ncbi:MAG: ABC transporter ATP-binding protein [Calditrichaeota bacterium]|nr:ABC transporter ATP-binding protein [Calditrichota bacterium]
MRPNLRIEEDSIDKKMVDRKLFSRLLDYGKPYWHWISGAVVLIIIGMSLEILGPYITKIAIDRYIIPGDLQGLLFIVALYFAVLIGNFLFKYLQIMLMQYIGQRVMLDLRQQLFSHLQRLQQQFFDKNPIGRLMTRVTSDVESLNQLFTEGLVMVFGDLLLIGGILVMMLSIHAPLALWTLSVVPLLLVLSFIFRKKVRESFSQIRVFLARINAYLQEHISGITIVQLYNREKKNFDMFKSINWDHTASYIRTIFYYALFYPAVELLGAVALAIIIFRGGFYIQNELVTFGILVAFIQYAQMFFRPISDLSEKYNILQSALAASERIFKLLDTKIAIKSSSDGYFTRELVKPIIFRNVSFAYHDEKVLQDIGLTIPIGQRYALVGHTGAGKTTLTRLLGRFYEIQEGEILIDGHDIRTWNLQNLRSHMAVVQQDVFLFSGTVIENIRLGKEDIPVSQVKEAAEMVNAHHFIEKMPGGYEAKIRERGGNLSQGQKQLLALARAIVFDPQILILDEATSNIDSESEYLIQQALKIVLAERTAIVIAHRLSTIQYMDQIVVMHHGKIHEIGDHQELLKKRGLYYRLYQLQYKDQEMAFLK